MGLTYDEMQIGDSAGFEKTLSEADVYAFAGITGDFNPAHVNRVKAEGGKFKARIAHGMLTASLISTVIGMKLPGEGTIYLGQEVQFKAPVFFGDTIKAEVTVIEKLEKGRVRLRTVCKNQANEIVVEGSAVVLAPRPEK